MKRLLLAAACLLAACGQPTPGPDTHPQPPAPDAVTLPQSDAAGNTLEALSQNDAEYTAHWCTADGAWCVSAPQEGPPIVIHEGATIALAPPDPNVTPAAWPLIIRMPRDGGGEDVIVGVTGTSQQMYSGGGASATFVSLHAISNGAASPASAPIPTGASVMIRACFDEDDARNRRDACHDLYNFVTAFSLDTTVASGAPRLVLETRASTYPGRVSRTEDSTQAPPLSEADLVYAPDEACSYRRVFTRGEDGIFTPDQPLPECADYLSP